MPFRNTEQALIQVVDSAQEKLLIVSYAVYNIPNVASALVRAAERGVRIRVVIESTDPKAGKDEYSNLKALGAKVAGCASVYYWPVENRDCSPSGKPGIMHVKCAVADGETIFLSSANLTAQAFSINMELGVLVTSGNLANNVQERFGRLIKEGTIVAV
jgi:phosphatidylserine/phosphatidylglycerophosphate/cardiolipin synthase-like enzyme